MITEDYCSATLIKLLKDKGFPFEIPKVVHGTYIPAVSLSRAMKWLREEHKIFIGVKYNNYYRQYKVNIIMMELSKSAILKHVEAMMKYSLDNIFYDTFEEAVEDALKCVLENLI